VPDVVNVPESDDEPDSRGYEQESQEEDEDFESGYEPPRPPVRRDSFRSRTGSLGRELKETLVPGSAIPARLQRLIGDDEQVLYASNPSRAALTIRMTLSALGAMLFNPFLIAVIQADSSLARMVLGILVVLFILLTLYLTYIAWRSQFFVITSRRIMMRTGWFNHVILMAPVQKIEMVTINSGIIDRWLGLNTICFETAAASGFGCLRTGVLIFASVHSEEVMTAYSQSLSKQSGQ
jgi:membrane protein YdbS with pleckstrin-like domain